MTDAVRARASSVVEGDLADRAAVDRLVEGPGRGAPRGGGLPHGRPSRRLLPRGQRAAGPSACSRRPRATACGASCTPRRSACTATSSTRRPTRRAPFAPGDIYQETKAEAEALAFDYHRRRGVPVAVVRPGAIYGPGRDAAAEAVSRDRARPLRDRRHAAGPSTTPSTSTTSWPATCWRSSATEAVGEAFLICGPRYVSQRELAALIAKRDRAGACCPFRIPARADPVGGRPGRGDLRAARASSRRSTGGASTSGPRAGRSRSRRPGGCSATRRRWASRRASRAPPPGTARRGGCERAARRGSRSRVAGARRSAGAALARRPAAGRAGRVLGRQRDVLRDGLEPRRGRDLRYDARDLARIRARVPARPAGPLPEARQRRPRRSTAAPGSRGCAACAPRRRGSTSRRRSSTRWSRRRSCCCSARAGSSSPTPCCWPLALWLAFASAAAPRARARLGARRERGARPAHRHAGLSGVADARDLRPRARDRRPRGVGGRAAAACRPLLFGIASYPKPPNVLLAAPLGLEPLLPARGRALARAVSRPRHRRVAAPRGRARPSTAGALLRGSTPPSRASSTTRAASARPSTAASRSTRRGADVRQHRHLDDHQPGGAARRGAGRGEGHRRERAARATRARSASRSCYNLGYFWIGRFGGVARVLLPGARGARPLPAGRPARPRGLAGARRARAFLARLHLDHPGQLVRRRRDDRQPLLPEPAAARSCSWSRRGAGRGSALAGLLAACVFLGAGPRARRSTTRSRPGGTRSRRAVPRAAGRAHDAERPVDLHGALAQEAAVRVHRRRRRQPRGSRRVLPLLHGRRHAGAARSGAAGAGFWLRGGARPRSWCGPSTRTARQNRGLRLRGGPRGRRRRRRASTAAQARASVGPGEARELELAAGRGLRYYDTYLHVLRLESRRGAALPDGRVVGAFAELRARHGTAGRLGGDAVSDRVARILLGVVSRLRAAAGRGSTCPRLPTVASGATAPRYHAMAGSLAFDGDLRVRGRGPGARAQRLPRRARRVCS